MRNFILIYAVVFQLIEREKITREKPCLQCFPPEVTKLMISEKCCFL